ncbi:Gfo/Idh/MocA family oxidoreductase [soil metagenome]
MSLDESSRLTARGRGPELRFAVVGAGWMGEAHLRAYTAQPGVRVVALVTRSSERGSELAERYPIETVFDDAVRMLDEVRPDGISVTTREDEHAGPACAALERGIGVLVEKPMSSRVADAERLVDVAARSGSLLVPAHILRFAPPYQALKREVESGRLGSIVAIAARRDRDRAIARHYGHVHPAMLTAVHDIDQVVWLTGAGVRRVRALEARRTDLPQPDLVWGHLELEGGILASISTATLLPEGGSVGSSDRLEVYGTAGHAAVDTTARLLAVETTHPARPDWLLEPPDGGGAFGAEIGHFCACLRAGRASDVISPAEALAGIRVADAMVRSAAAGGAIIDL